jgi:pimeloyl-ACP methyl ester carboxylesterase/DNA-binding SARP family transcriptional activator
MTFDAIPPIRFADAHGARIAYQDFGEGPTILAIPPLAQNIEIAWEWEDIATMLQRFAGFSRFIHFDKRGTGASDRRSRVNDIDERVDDLRAVMDTAGVDRAHLFASSEGGPMAILFAATYPHRTESLVLWGTGPYMAPPDWDAAEVAAGRQRSEYFATVWGTPESFIVDRFAPSLAANQEFRTWHQRYERAAASQDSLRDLSELMWHMDVREVLPQIEVPTLVLHRIGDQPIPIEFGRELAAGIPGAELIELEGDDHFSYAGDRGWMDIMERWVTGTVVAKPTPAPYPTSVRIETLGRFRALVDGVEVETAVWGSRLARLLCKRLVAARGWPVTRDELFDLFWPDEYDRRKLGPRLSVQLSAVRKVLRGGVVADRDSVRLDLEEVSTDVDELFSAEDDGAIVAAYRGEFLPEDVYEDWTGPIRDEARARFVAAARRLATIAAANARHREAAQFARRLTATDRYDEDAHRRLIAALTAMGELREADRAHAVYAEAMAELDVEVVPLS